MPAICLAPDAPMTGGPAAHLNCFVTSLKRGDIDLEIDSRIDGPKKSDLLDILGDCVFLRRLYSWCNNS